MPLKSKKNKKNTQPKVSDRLTINSSKAKKSSYVVNLKNPNQGIFEDNFSLKQSNFSKTKTVPKTPSLRLKPTSKKRNKVGVNFISTKKSRPKFKKSIVKKTPILELSKESKDAPLTFSSPQKAEELEDIFAPAVHENFLKISLPYNWQKKLTVFVLISVVLILPLQAVTYYQDLQDVKDKILLITNEAIENLKSGQQAASELDLTTADFDFDQAKSNFALAQQEVSNLNILSSEILKLLPAQEQSVENGLNLLQAGEIIAETGQILINSGQNLLSGGNLTDYYKSLVTFESSLRLVIDKFKQAKEKIENIDPNFLPPEHQETFTKVLTQLPSIHQGLINVYDINHTLLKLLGHEQWQRYLIVFLNNNELRGGGGFMGSFAILDIDRGEIKNLEVPGGGTYDIQGQLVPRVISPEPLHLINSRWEFQDSNWWPDYPTSAKKMQWFYQNAGGPSVDGVITITSTLMERLLDVFGPISMPEYGRDITSENFVIETQKIVELEYDKEENKPKQFIADLTPRLLDLIFSADNDQLADLFNTLKKGLNEKQFIVYFNDQQTQELVANFDWSAEIKETDGDYLSVVHSNIAGGKTDGVIKETIEHQAEIQNDGSIINTVKLIRRHTGVAGENIFTGVQNNSYVRFYVPLGSVLLESSGFEKPPIELFEEPEDDYVADIDLISVESNHTKDEASGMDVYKESGKTVFGHWLQLKPGEIGQAIIKYRLPFKLALEGKNIFYYSLLAQKQAGSIGSNLKSNLILNNNFKPMAKFPAELASDDTEVSFNKSLTTDQFYGVALVNK
ncbi:MAG: hypothetical protein CMI53_04830 [Parcubacteria group bacterium]|nr:hypothetical protein [Parcubacteria group bacterium]